MKLEAIRAPALRALAFSLSILVGGFTTPAWADPPGSSTVAQFREFLSEMEKRYDERAARAVAIFFADGALAQEYLWGDCLRRTAVRELREWIRDSAPPELTLLEALRLNAKERGCQPRDLADTDAELAIRGGPKHDLTR